MEEPTLLETVEIHPRGKATGAVIWLHGLGADGHDFEAIVPELHLPATLTLRFVFPHAPVRRVTLNAGMAMRAWFDIVALDRSGAQDEAGIRASNRELERLIQRECERGLTLGRIALAGFSQGGAIALATGLGYPGRLAGLMGLSTYLPLEQQVFAEASAANRDVPIILAHGTLDPILPLAFGEHARDRLLAHGYEVEWHSYPIAHAVCPEEIHDIRDWLMRVF